MSTNHNHSNTALFPLTGTASLCLLYLRTFIPALKNLFKNIIKSPV
ncbi:hypothetical protein [Mucilaginibacter sp. L3T2-6]|nr:hypothetical protein [Mucilaginibacter sp. L3T2-6]MDO3641259.1 hypothetical protein [Mucilaginibacter sp. L3T2-6]MDV6213981.1 hypothetical protein [Mucilaginibacter sp. L3T2-6]